MKNEPQHDSKKILIFEDRNSCKTIHNGTAIIQKYENQ